MYKGLFIIFCCILSPGCVHEDVTIFTTSSSIFFSGKKNIIAKFNNENKNILISKLKSLHTIETVDKCENCFPYFLSSYNYSLIIANKKTKIEFMIRNRTWIGNTTIYHFNAENLISKETWNEVDKKLRTTYEDSVDAENKKIINDVLSDISSCSGNNH